MLQFQIDPLVEAALREDIGFGDITTELLPGAGREVTANFLCKEAGVLCGGIVAERCFELLDGNCAAEFSFHEGAAINPGMVIGVVQGPLASVLTAERVALNFLQRMSGIASKTQRLARIAAPHGIAVSETRKTSPGLRLFEKYAVRCGGGSNHRMDLSHAVMLKDNHFAACAMAPAELIAQMRRAGHTVKIVAEATSPAMAAVLAAGGADVVLLDNFVPAQVAEAVGLIDGRALVEVSGGVDEDNIADYLLPGVQVISVGALTHSYNSLDISLEVG